MSNRVLFTVVLLAGCAAAPTPPAPPPAAAALPPPQAECVCPKAVGPLPAGPTPAQRATRDYRSAETGIAPAVTSPAASAAYIRAVERADKLARTALRNLVALDGHPTQAAISEARSALDELVTTLEAPN